MGAICLPEHTNRLQALVDEAIAKGAEIAVRGKLFISNLGDDVGGQFYPPTVILNVNHTMKLMQEEVYKLGYDEREIFELADILIL